MLFVGKAQEKASVFRTEKRRDAAGEDVPLDHPLDDAGQSLLRLHPRPRLRPAVHQVLLLLSLRREALSERARVAQTPADAARHRRSSRSTTASARPTAAARVQRIADTLDAAKIDAVFRKWLRRLPHPFAPAHRAAGYRYQLSILQAEFALTQVLDRPLTGRCFFEEVIRENLDLGRPDQMQLIFDRRVTRRTPGRFRTRVLTEGVVPSLHVEYKKSKVKQYHKEGQALRTETTINDTYDFDIGRALRNLPALREIGFAANRRLLHVESLSHDCLIGEDHLDAVTPPVVVARPTRRRPPLRRPPRPRADAHALSLRAGPHRLPPSGRARPRRAAPRPRSRRPIRPAPMTYDLRRLRLHGLIERVPHSHRYRITAARRRRSRCSTRVSTPGRSAPPASLQPRASARGPARLRSARRRARRLPSGGQTCRLKNLTQILTLLGVKTPRKVRRV